MNLFIAHQKSVNELYKLFSRHNSSHALELSGYTYVIGFAKTVLKGTFCNSRNTNLKIFNIEATVVLMCYNVVMPDSQYK